MLPLALTLIITNCSPIYPTINVTINIIKCWYQMIWVAYHEHMVSGKELHNHLCSVSCFRYCGTSLPPDLTSSGPLMTVVFVADEGVADSGFNVSYQAISLSQREFLPQDTQDYSELVQCFSILALRWPQDCTLMFHSSTITQTEISKSVIYLFSTSWLNVALLPKA